MTAVDFRKNLSGSRGPADALTASISAAVRSKDRTPKDPAQRSGIYKGKGPSKMQGEVVITRDPNSEPFKGANRLLFTATARQLSDVHFTVDSGVTFAYVLVADGQILNWDNVANVSLGMGDPKYKYFRFDGQSATKANRCRFINLGNVAAWYIEDVESFQKLGLKGAIVAGAAVFPWHGARGKCPRDGFIRRHKNSGSPSGYGPNQIASAENCAAGDILSDGGTALRLETDGNACGLHGFWADNIEGLNGNRSLAMSAHDVDSEDVHITNLKGTSMFEGIRLAAGTGGKFRKTTVEGGDFVYGTHAQNPAKGGVAGSDPSSKVLSMSGGHDVIVHGIRYSGFTVKNRGDYKNPDGSPVYA